MLRRLADFAALAWDDGADRAIGGICPLARHAVAPARQVATARRRASHRAARPRRAAFAVAFSLSSTGAPIPPPRRELSHPGLADRRPSPLSRRLHRSLCRPHARLAAATEETWPALADARSSQGLFAGTPPRAKAAWLAQKRCATPSSPLAPTVHRSGDIDGNVYTDYCLGFGVHLFGHRPHFLQAALAEQLERGLPIGFQSDRANQVARAIVAMTGMERVAFCNTGAEAVMGALRLARAVTSRDRIVCFAHAYHGSYDGTLPAIDMPSGLPASLRRDVQVLEYGSPASLQAIADGADGIAAVLVEPVRARSPSLQPVEFLRALRTLTRDRGIALVFDEVLLGFRIHQGGCQNYFGVCADLATYGKILGGGLPIGVIAGSARFLDRIDGGCWHHAGDSARAATGLVRRYLHQNPLTMAALLPSPPSFSTAAPPCKSPQRPHR